MTRYGLQGLSTRKQPARRTGDVTSVVGEGVNVPGWMQYREVDRRVYEGVDIGPAALLKMLLVPQGFKMSRGGER